MRSKNETFREWCQRMESAPGRDGTAIDWDTECARSPLDFDARECVLDCLLALGVSAVVLGMLGTVFGWWPL